MAEVRGQIGRSSDTSDDALRYAHERADRDQRPMVVYRRFQQHTMRAGGGDGLRSDLVEQSITWFVKPEGDPPPADAPVFAVVHPS